jgi:hypothetical protein
MQGAVSETGFLQKNKMLHHGSTSWHRALHFGKGSTLSAAFIQLPPSS